MTTCNCNMFKNLGTCYHTGYRPFKSKPIVIEQAKVSGPYMGPHALFTEDELLAILSLLPSSQYPIIASIRLKIETALASDPALHQPMK